MISNNSVDFTGMSFNVQEKIGTDNSTILFNLSIPNSYTDSNNERITKYDNILCMYTKKLINAQNENKYEYLKKNLKNQCVVRIQGRLASWSNKDTNTDRHGIRVKEFEIVKNTISKDISNQETIDVGEINDYPYDLKW